MTPKTPGTQRTSAAMTLDALSVRLPFQLKKILTASHAAKQVSTTSSEKT